MHYLFFQSYGRGIATLIQVFWLPLRLGLTQDDPSHYGTSMWPQHVKLQSQDRNQGHGNTRTLTPKTQESETDSHAFRATSRIVFPAHIHAGYIGAKDCSETSGSWSNESENHETQGRNDAQKRGNFLDAVLDPTGHFDHLDSLELRVADCFNLWRSRRLEDADHLFNLSSNIEDCITGFGEVLSAMTLLQDEGFSEDSFSILVNDPKRLAVAKALVFRKDCIAEVRNRLQELPFSADFSDVAFVQRYEEIVSFVEALLSPLCVSNIQDDANTSTTAFSSKRRLEYACNVLYAVLCLGLISYTRSHVCDFDRTIFGTALEDPYIFITANICLHRRKLACLGDLVGGPAWIFGPRTIQDKFRYSVSIDINTLTDLWGPAWAIPDGRSSDLYREIYTERGSIYRVPGFPDQEVLGDETACHWKPASALTTLGRLEQTLRYEEACPDQASLIDSSSTLLIGKEECTIPGSLTPAADVAHENPPVLQKSPAKLLSNKGCQVDVQHILEKKAEHVHPPGTSESSYEPDTYQISGNVSKIVAIGAAKTYKRTKGTTHKNILLQLCMMTEADLLPILNLFIGLEVSHCTINARRITLWEALRLANKSKGTPNNHCSHKAGQIACLKSCWQFSHSNDRSAVNSWNLTTTCDTIDPVSGDSSDVVAKKASLRGVVVRAIARMENTGVNKGTLQAWYPFTQYPCTISISPRSGPKTLPERHGWIPMLQESRDVCAFAVISQSCLTSPVNPDSSLLWGTCHGSKVTASRSWLQTTLYCVRAPPKIAQLIPKQDSDKEIPDQGLLYLQNVGSIKRIGKNRNVLEYMGNKSVTAWLRNSDSIVVRELISEEIGTHRRSSVLVL